MEKPKTLVATAFTILGIIIGASANHYLASKREMNRDLFSARLDAYVAFMEGQGLRAKAENDEDNKNANLQITKAKYSLAMLSSEEVLKAMVHYWNADPEFTFDKCPETTLRRLDASIYQEIRKEMIRGEENKIDAANVLIPFLWSCTADE